MAFPLGRGGAYLVGSSFLPLDSLLVDVHWFVVGRGREAISVGYVAGGLVGLVLCRRIVGERGEDGRREDVLKRGEHLCTTRLDRGRVKVVMVHSGRAIIGEVEMVRNLLKRSHISRTRT